MITTIQSIIKKTSITYFKSQIKIGEQSPIFICALTGRDGSDIIELLNFCDLNRGDEVRFYGKIKNCPKAVFLIQFSASHFLALALV